MTVKDLEKLLKKAGWVLGTGTNHSKWTKGNQAVMVPRHKGDLKKGTAEGILKQAGLK